MTHKPLLAFILVLALVTMACGITVPVQTKTGPTITDTIDVPSTPGTQDYTVKLSFGAGNFTLKPGAGDKVVSGTVTYNIKDFQPKVTTNQNVIHVEQGNLELGGIPNFKNDFRNDWVMQLGDVPIRLEVNAGAYTGRYELGGLSLENLSIADGAADVDLAFTRPNLVDMDTFTYNTGASNVNLTSLANARFAEMKFRSGAGDYKLDFGGDLRFDTSVTIESGLSNVTIIVPVGVRAHVTFEGGLTKVTASGEWEKNGNEYTQSGSGPELTMVVKMGAGSLNLKNP